MKTNAQLLGEAISADREKADVSQGQVAAAVGVTQQAYSGWEAGASMPRSARLRMLADYFGPESRTVAAIKEIYPKQWLSPLNAERADAPGDWGDPAPPKNPSFDFVAKTAASNREIDKQWHDDEMHDALSRAVKGVDLARQVLDDASIQLNRAMRQLQNK